MLSNWLSMSLIRPLDTSIVQRRKCPWLSSLFVGYLLVYLHPYLFIYTLIYFKLNTKYVHVTILLIFQTQANARHADTSVSLFHVSRTPSAPNSTKPHHSSPPLSVRAIRRNSSLEQIPLQQIASSRNETSNQLMMVSSFHLSASLCARKPEMQTANKIACSSAKGLKH